MSGSNGLGVRNLLALLLVAGVLLGACGGDDDGGDSEGGDGDGTTTGDGDSTMSGDGDSTMTGDGDGDVEIPSIPCGTNTCMDVGAGFGSFDFSGFMIPGFDPATFDAGSVADQIPMVCCADADTGTCGTSRGGGPCEPPPVSDDRCPELVTPIGINGPSCCTMGTETCGLVDIITGTNECLSLTEVTELFAGLGPLSGLITIPMPVNCDGSAVVVPDAGMMSTDDDAGMD